MLPDSLPPEVDVLTVRAWLDEDKSVVLVDVRDGWERDTCSISGSRHIPLQSLPDHLGELPRDVPLIMVCHHGMRSAQATRWLRGQGLANAVNMAGGIEAWAVHVDPGMERY
jgi:rhodanese-related sulfurtransferase